MSTPNYVTLVSGVVDALKADTTLTATVPAANIYYGGIEQQAFISRPSITVMLTDGVETDVAMPNRKEMTARILLTVYNESPDYMTGLQGLEDVVRKIDDALQSDYTVGSQALYSQVTNRRFGVGVYDNVPLQACEMDLAVRVRFVRASN